MNRVAAACLCAAALLSLLLVNPQVRGDGHGYFAWIASAVVDHDLDFRNQYRHGNALFTERFLDADGVARAERMTSTGLIENQWAIGPALLWAPWFVSAHAIVRLTGQDPQDGYASIYRRACAMGSLCYAIAAIWLSVRVARACGVSRSSAWWGAAVTWGGTSLLVYAELLPFHVHALAAFTVAWFLWFGVTRVASMTYRQWMLWGALAALMGMTYYLDTVFVVVAVVIAVGAQPRLGVLGALSRLAAFSVAALVLSLPHWWSKAALYGSPWTTGYRDQFFWLTPRVWMTAFSSNHGVILWTPLVAVGVAGVAWLSRRNLVFVGVAIALALFFLVVASYEQWHGLSSFGNRFFVSWTLPVAVGTAVVLEAARSRGRVLRVASQVGCVILVLWNVGLAFQWASKMVPNRGPVDIWKVAAQQAAVPRRAVIVGWRYLTDRHRLAAEIEEQDQQEWRRFQESR